MQFLFGLPYFSSILIFLLLKSQVAVDWRIKFGLWHASIGRFIILGGLCTCIAGWADYQMILVAGNQDHYNSATMLEAGIGIALAIQIAALYLFFNKDVSSAQNNYGHKLDIMTGIDCQRRRETWPRPCNSHDDGLVLKVLP